MPSFGNWGFVLATPDHGTPPPLRLSPDAPGLRYLDDMLDAEGQRFLAATPVFVPHARIAENAQALGLQQVVLTAPADAGIIAGLCAYNWPKKD